MSEDDSRRPADSEEKPAEKPHRSWLDRISAALSGEPTSREDLIELLRDVQADGLIGPDTLRMMEGAVNIADMTVGDVMVSRAQMVSLPADARFIDLMKQVVESATRASRCMARTATRSWASCWPRTCCAGWWPTTAQATSTRCCARRC